MSEIESTKRDRQTARARGLRSNPSGRFERERRAPVDDGWLQEPDPVSRTVVQTDASRRVITRNRSPDVPFDRSINPYRGCEHGCTYCFARPSHAFLGLSPGLDFETQIFAKPEAPALLEAELSRPGYRPAVLAIGTNTDPYQPVEARLEIMRGILSVLAAFRHPVGVVTKGSLVRRDADLLGEMAGDGLASVGISLTSLDAGLCRAMEPRAAAPVQRLKSIEALARAGVPVRAMVAPVIPGLTDLELEALLAAARDAGATSASYVVLRLPLEVADLFRDWLEEHAPDRAAKVMARVREMHGGRDYDPAWGTRMTGQGSAARLLADRFRIAMRRLGLGEARAVLRTDLFRVPRRDGQLSLF